jgi:hypothetical protein
MTVEINWMLNAKKRRSPLIKFLLTYLQNHISHYITWELFKHLVLYLWITSFKYCAYILQYTFWKYLSVSRVRIWSYLFASLTQQWISTSVILLSGEIKLWQIQCICYSELQILKYMSESHEFFFTAIDTLCSQI